MAASERLGSTCPDPMALADFVHGTLPSAEREGIEAHIDACGQCRRVVAELVRSSTAQPALDPLHLARGDQLDRYLILEVVGSGGMGIVYAAHDPALGRKIAIKVLRNPGPAQRRLVREARAMARVSHPNVVTLYDVGTYGDTVFLAMELVDAVTFTAWVRSGHPSRNVILDRMLQAGRGLDAAHRAGIVHRDFKPDNVLVTADGRVLVTDFGLAKLGGATDDPPAPGASLPSGGEESALDQTVTRTQTYALVGTPAYMAPEQYQGSAATPASDQYSFCVSLYECLVGERPPRPQIASGDVTAPAGVTATVSASVSERTLDRVPQASVRAVLRRGLAADPDRRYPSMTALLADLDRHQRRRRRLVRALALTALLGTTAVIAALLALGRAREQPCTDAFARSRTVWNDGVRQGLTNAVASHGVPGATVVAEHVQRGFERFGSAWREAYTRTCQATHVHGTQSQEALTVRSDCLHRQLDVARIHLASIRRQLGDPKGAWDRVAAVVRSLPLPAQCLEYDSGELERLWPADPAARAAVARVRDELQRIAGLRLLEQRPAAEAALAEIMPAAEATGFAPVRVEFLVERARVQQSMENIAALERALELASGWIGLHLLGEVLRELANVMTLDAAHHDEAEIYARIAVLGAQQVGDRAAVVFGLTALANVKRARAELEVAERIALDALALLDAEPDPDPERRARVLLLLARIADERHDPAALNEYAEAGLRAATEALGEGHPGLLAYLEGRANAHAELGREDEAAAHFERAIGIAERSLRQPSRELARLLANRASLHGKRREYEAAIPLYERARRIHAALGDTASSSHGQLLLDLARAKLALQPGADVEAEILLGKRIDAHHFGVESQRHHDWLLVEAEAYLQRAELARARTTMERARALWPHISPSADAILAAELLDARIYWASGQRQDAVAGLRRARGQAEAATRFMQAEVDAWLARHESLTGPVPAGDTAGNGGKSPASEPER